jgi:hypothetical protein
VANQRVKCAVDTHATPPTAAQRESAVLWTSKSSAVYWL